MYRSAGTVPGGKLSRGSPVHDVVQLISQERARIQELVAALQVSMHFLAVWKVDTYSGQPRYLPYMTACIWANQLGLDDA